jgi:glycosyltransferase involved in cell wall biosynthesis
MPSGDTDANGGNSNGNGNGNGPIVLGVGRLEHNKGFDLLLRAVAGSPLLANPEDGAPAVRVRLVGDGTQREQLAALARTLGIHHQVEMVGALDAAGVTREMAEAAVVVVPSRTEAFGMVVLEAWRAGTPVVATSLGGPAGFVRDGVDGVLVDPTDGSALAAAISHVVGDLASARAMAQAGRESVQDYTWKATADAYAAIYDQLVDVPVHPSTTR